MSNFNLPPGVTVEDIDEHFGDDAAPSREERAMEKADRDHDSKRDEPKEKP